MDKRQRDPPVIKFFWWIALRLSTLLQPDKPFNAMH